MNVMAMLDAARRFVATYAALMRGHLLQHKAELIVVTVLGAVGAVAQGAVVAFIVATVSMFEGKAGRSLPIIGELIQNRSVGIIGSALCLAALLAIGAWASYVAAVRIRRLGRGFHQACVRTSLFAIADAPGIALSGLHDDLNSFRRLVILGSNQLGNALEDIVRTIEPVFRCAISFAILFWISPKLTLIMIPILLVMIPVVYRASREVTSDSQKYFDVASIRMFEQLSALVDVIGYGNLRRPPAVEAELGRFLNDASGLGGCFDEYDKLQLAHSRSLYRINLATSSFLVFSLLSSSYLASGGQISWGLMLGYLMALLQFIQSARTLQSYLTSLSMYFSSARRHLLLRDLASPVVSGSAEDMPVDVVMRSSQALPGGEATLTLRRGRPVYVLSAKALDRVSLRSMISQLAAASGVFASVWERNTCFLGMRAQLPEWAMSTPGALEERQHRLSDSAVARIAARAGVERELGDLQQALGVDPGAKVWNDLSRPLRIALFFASIQNQAQQVVILDSRLLAGLRAETAMPLLEALADRFLLLVTMGMPPKDALADAVVVLAEDGIAGIGSREWLKQARLDLVAGGESGADSVEMFAQESAG